MWKHSRDIMMPFKKLKFKRTNPNLIYGTINYMHDDVVWQSLPRQTRKIFSPNPNKSRVVIEKRRPVPSYENKIKYRVNEMGIQMLSKPLYDQIFKGYGVDKENQVSPRSYKSTEHQQILENQQFEKFPENQQIPQNKQLEINQLPKNQQFPQGTQIVEESLVTENLQRENLEPLPINKFIDNNKFAERAKVAEIKKLDESKATLLKHGMVSNEADFLKDIDIELPKLEGKNLEEHFYNIGETQAGPYKILVENLLKSIPRKPKQWVMQEGWTRYQPGRSPRKVEYPFEYGLIFDVEVCMSSGQAPTLAVAVSDTAWYAWVSKSLIDESSLAVTNEQYPLEALIPFETTHKENSFATKTKLSEPKIVIGHNVSFDRARIKEQYWLEQTGLKFLDTMSLHICVSGLTSYQRALLKSKKDDDIDDDADVEAWKKYSSLNSLSEVHKLYCGDEIEKDTRELFTKGTIKDVKDNFEEAMNYCSRDVEATYNILKKLYPIFLERFPHPVTLAGMLELGTGLLPVNANWNRYISNSEQAYEDLDIESRLLLAKRADQACHLLHDEKYRENVWMWDQDWEVKDIKLKTIKSSKKKANEEMVETVHIEEKQLVEEKCDEELQRLEEKFKPLFETAHFLPSKIPLLPGYPNWYRKLCTKPNASTDWVPSPHLISTSMQVTPKLLSLMWEGYPLHYIRGHGWGFLVPFNYDLDVDTKLPLKQLLEKCPVQSKKPNTSKVRIDATALHKQVEESLCKRQFYQNYKTNPDDFYKGSGVWCDIILEECCFFLKLPHKNGPSYRVGNPLAKDFLNKFSENVLSGDTEGAEKVLAIARQLSYWRNNKDRIKEQMVVRLENGNKSNDSMFGSIVPQVVVSGTLTRRAVEATWMTASNAHEERVGSELRAMVQAPSGFYFVGADVDSQELWIASVIGDAYHAKTHGCTPLGWMTLSGNKSMGTDMHSVTAKAIGISREHAKVINYARIYGAGQKFAQRLLKQFNPTLSDSEAKHKASKMFTLTKGKQVYKLKKKYLGSIGIENQYCVKYEAYEMAKLHGITVHEMFERPIWINGTESAMFNRLEEIACSENPVTPFLNCRLTRALEPQLVQSDQFLPTRINWVVQSGAVDFLHLMLVCMKWLMGNNVRFCLSFHDEVRYLVKEEDKYKAALAMHISNLLTRSFCCIKLGLHDLPQSVAFFSSVEVDKVLRKDSNHDCVTPSNPHGLQKGYRIPFGESLDIYETVEKCKVVRDKR